MEWSIRSERKWWLCWVCFWYWTLRFRFRARLFAGDRSDRFRDRHRRFRRRDRRRDCFHQEYGDGSHSRRRQRTSAVFTPFPTLRRATMRLGLRQRDFQRPFNQNVCSRVGQQQQLNFSLKVGETSHNRGSHRSSAADRSHVVGAHRTGGIARPCANCLSNGRDWTSLAVLQPGVKAIETQMSYATSARGNRGFGGEMTISGQRSTFNNYRIDGISVNDYAMAAPGNVIGVVLGVDAIQEFSGLDRRLPRGIWPRHRRRRERDQPLGNQPVPRRRVRIPEKQRIGLARLLYEGRRAAANSPLQAQSVWRFSGCAHHQGQAVRLRGLRRAAPVEGYS